MGLKVLQSRCSRTVFLLESLAKTLSFAFPACKGIQLTTHGLHVAQQKIVNLLKTFFFSLTSFHSVCVFNVWPKTTLLLLPMCYRDTKRSYTPVSYLDSLPLSCVPAMASLQSFFCNRCLFSDSGLLASFFNSDYISPIQVIQENLPIQDP